MDVKIASQRMIDSFVAAIDPDRAREEPKATLAHLRYMNAHIQAGVVTGEKAHRWLGWIQAVTYLCGGATHEQIQQVNKES